MSTLVGATVGVGVDGRTVGVAVEPQAARPTTAIAVPMTVVSFIFCLYPLDTEHVIHGYFPDVPPVEGRQADEPLPKDAVRVCEGGRRLERMCLPLLTHSAINEGRLRAPANPLTRRQPGAHAGMVTERSYPSTITGYVPALVGPKKNGLAPSTSTTLPSNVMVSGTSPSSVSPCVNVNVTLPTPGSPATHAAAFASTISIRVGSSAFTK